MSVACETIGSEDEAVSRCTNNEKDSYEEEELDYEEEMEDPKSNNNNNNHNLKNDDEEDGELSDDQDTATEGNVSNVKEPRPDKDEGIYSRSTLIIKVWLSK